MQNIGSKRKSQEYKTSHRVNSTAANALCAVSLALNSPVTIERHVTRLRYFSLKSDYRVRTIIIVSLASALYEIGENYPYCSESRRASFYWGQCMQSVMVAFLKFVSLTSASISVAFERSAWSGSAFESLISKRVELGEINTRSFSSSADSKTREISVVEVSYD